MYGQEASYFVESTSTSLGVFVLFCALIFLIVLVCMTLGSYFDSCYDDKYYQKNHGISYYDYPQNGTTYRQNTNTTKVNEKIEVKLTKTPIEVVNDIVKATDIDGSPIGKFKPKKREVKEAISKVVSKVSGVKTEKAETSTNETRCIAKSVLIYYNVALGNFNKIVYNAIIGYLSTEIADKKKLYHVLSSIVHIDAYAKSVTIYYRKCQTIYSNYTFNIDELTKAIQFAMDDKTLKVKFVLMENTSITEYYLENLKKKE